YQYAPRSGNLELWCFQCLGARKLVFQECWTRRVAAAFQVATARSPGRTRSPSTLASVTSAASGCGAARPTRTRVPATVTETTATARRLRALPAAAAPGGSSATPHGWT